MSDSTLRESNRRRLDVLLVPDSIYWILGTIAKGIAQANPWIDATIVSGPVLETLARDDPEFFDRFDLVHFICPYASKTWLTHLQERRPVVTSHHHVTEWSAVSHNVDGDAIITGSPEWIDDLVSRGVQRDRVLCIPYGVDSNLFVPASQAQKNSIRKRLGIAKLGPVVGFFAKRMSNDDDRKGIDVFAEAIRVLHRHEPDASVLIVGPGWKELVAAFRDDGIACVWVPFLEKLEDVAEIYHALDFYWVTARIEGGPVPLLEAMSSEVCCLTTPVGLAREIVSPGVNAALLPMNDPRTFAETTLSLWKDRETRVSIAKEGRRTIVGRMHMGDTLKGVSEAYDRALQNFAARTGESPASSDSTSRENARASTPSAVPLHALGLSERKKVVMLESLAWTEHLLLYQGQRAAALRLIAKAWKQDPLSLQPARILLRRFLPESFVRRIVRMKHKLAAA